MPKQVKLNYCYYLCAVCAACCCPLFSSGGAFAQSLIPSAYEAVETGSTGFFDPAAINSRGEAVFSLFRYTPVAGVQQLANPPSGLFRGQRLTAISDTGVYGGIETIQVNGPGGGGCSFRDTVFPSSLIPQNTPLRPLPSEIRGVQVVGRCETDTCDLAQGRESFACAYLGTDGGVQWDFNDSGVTINKGNAAAFNTGGTYVGDSSRVVSGVRVQRAFSASVSSGITDLGTFSGFSNSAATDINNAGVIVGNGFDPSTGASLPFIRTSAGSGNQPIPLLASNTKGAANAINDSGLVVGFSENAQGDQRATVFEQGGDSSIDLNSLIDPPIDGGWTITEALDINFSGEIAARATRLTAQGSEYKVFVLRPRNSELPPLHRFTESTLSSNAIWRPSTGIWAVRNTMVDDTPFPDNLAFVQQWGLPGDVPLSGDYDGDGFTDLTVWRPSEGNWYQLINSVFPRVTQFGLPGDFPLQIDVTGDRIDDIAVWRPSNGSWYIRREGLGPQIYQWGLPGDSPVPADFDGDGQADFAVWRPSTGEWYILYSAKFYSPLPGEFLQKQFGLPGDTPIPGDYDGDERADIAVWRPSNGNWYICSSRLEFECSRAAVVQFGLPGDIAIAGRHLESDAYSLTVFRPGFGLWFSRGVESTRFSIRQWGLNGDIPTGRSVQKTTY